MNVAKERVQVVLVNENMPESEAYGGYRGYAVEIDGEWAADAKGYDHGCSIAASLTDTTATAWVEHLIDARGQEVWTHR